MKDDIDKRFMAMAFAQAQLAYAAGEVPVGAILTFQDKVICKAQNQTELLKDVTAHAEIIAISSASEHLRTKFFNQCALYVTLEPCAMCAGAIGWARLGKLVFGASDHEKGYQKLATSVLHKKTKVITGVLAEESKQLLQEFFASKRKR